ncbi:unnamed protein product [Caenorhabditis auriculariae]|uniref:Uncharacterized protein n=1 Tax=Caenorhabditis auriculariae TaxID=2777116 RepID=A0A8S1GTE9_9PELO|nr:unnamed protein product [Caenorhabditis auriculariae]
MWFLLSFVFVFAFVRADNCNLNQFPSSWASINTKNVFLYGVTTPANYPNTSFCSQYDTTSNSITVHSHIHLARQNMVYNDTVTAGPPSVSNCANFNSQLTYCKNHCIDTAFLKRVIDIGVGNSLPLAVSNAIYQYLGSPPDWTVSTFQVDPAKGTPEIDYEYYNDKYFCAVQIKASNVPYSRLIVATRIIT